MCGFPAQATWWHRTPIHYHEDGDESCLKHSGSARSVLPDLLLDDFQPPPAKRQYNAAPRRRRRRAAGHHSGNSTMNETYHLISSVT